MEINALTGDDICNIIKMCAKSQVAELKLGDFHVHFKVSGTIPAQTSEEAAPLQSGEIEKTEQPTNYELSIAQQRAIEDIGLAQNIIDDPMQFEEDVIDSWTRAGDEETESGRTKPSV